MLGRASFQPGTAVSKTAEFDSSCSIWTTNMSICLFRKFRSVLCEVLLLMWLL